MEIAGTTALITGGAHRVGRAITLALAGAGAHVAIAHHSSATEAAATVDEARALGVDALAVETDVADPEAVAALVETVERELGPIDVLVNSASAFAVDPFPTTDFSTWHRTFDVVVHVRVSPAARRRRTPDDRAWELPAFDRYDDEVDPVSLADAVVLADSPDHPALVLQGRFG